MPPKKITADQTDSASDAHAQEMNILPDPIPMPAEESNAQKANLLLQIPAKWAIPPAELVSKLPKGGTQLDYMGHADVTLALLQIDPFFDYGWLCKEDGSMLINKMGDLYVLEGWLTVLGHTRRGVGTCEARKTEIQKELIGDLLRNISMRFGIATTLWSKAERHEWGVPQDSLSGKAFEVLREVTKDFTADQRSLLRSWWGESFGEIPVNADAGSDKIILAIAEAKAILSRKADEEQPTVAPEGLTIDEITSFFPGAEIVETTK